MTPRTNRELYLAICDIAKTAKSGRENENSARITPQPLDQPNGYALESPSRQRSLENYLLALLRLSQAFAGRTALKVDEFLGLLAGAFLAEPLPFQSTWREIEAPPEAKPFDFKTWKSIVIAQIVDLREMDENGELRNEYRYGGIDSPRGNRWYNFDSTSFLECAAAGTIGGWEPGDVTGRSFVPGPCLATDPSGNPVLVNPEDIERPHFGLPDRISWEFFADFLECGQQYE